ncbi:unnamed protein product, partial [Prorocentrum cordatum]
MRDKARRFKGPPRSIAVGSTCSGAGTLEFALQDLGADYDVKFACDNDRWVKVFYQAHHHAKFWLDDALDECHEHAPYVDVYAAGWPCQGMSQSGYMQGADDPRTQVAQGVKKYIQKKMPKMFMLENVPTMATTFASFFKSLLQFFMRLKLADGSAAYEVRWKFLNACDNGSPQNRKRIYIIGLRRDAIVKPFAWPPSMSTPPLSSALDMEDVVPGPRTFPESWRARTNVETALAELASQNIDPDSVDVIVDTDTGKDSCFYVNRAPTLTASRRSGRAYWLLKNNRRAKMSELFALQGFRHRDIIMTSVPQPQLGKIVGNAFAQCVV